MLINSKKRLVIAVFLLVLLVLGAGAVAFLRNLDTLEQSVETTFHSRSQLLKAFVTLHRGQVAVMRNLMVANYQERGVAGAGELLTLREYPQQKVWMLVNADGRQAGTLTGNTPLPLSASQQGEIAAALTLDSQVRAELAHSSEVAWLYYLSASGFIYLAPGVPPERFSFSPSLYQRDYWVKNSPQNNPQRRMIVVGPYRDQAGKGWIFTFAQPVYFGDQLLGVVALELLIDTLQQLVDIGEAPGDTLLVSEGGNLIAHNGAYEPGSHVTPPMSAIPADWRPDEQGDRWLSTPVVENELWVLHQIKRGELAWAAARKSIPAWLLIGLTGLLCAFTWRLLGLLALLTRMTHTDPLTQTLNRRGFYDKAQGLLALAERKSLATAVLVLDIDFFKKINDVHGHPAGDKVLKQLGGYLLKACRTSDLVCRWGGEEFVVVLLLDDASHALGAAERVRQAAQCTQIPGGEQTVTLSGGLVLLQSGEDLDAAVKRADLLLYQAKSGGRNRIVSGLAALADNAGDPAPAGAPGNIPSRS